jgi:site-specific recombinase XerD
MTDTTDQKRPSEKLSPNYDDCVDKHLKQAIADYLQWMKSVGYARKTRRSHQTRLNQFLCFSKSTTISWEKLFTSNSLECFKKSSGQSAVPAINALSRYLFSQGKIPKPFSNRPPPIDLPKIYEDYLSYQQTHRQATARRTASCRIYRCNLRGFLKYLYHERNIIKRDLARFVVGRREYAQSKPPHFLRPQEIRKLFAGLTLGSASDIRTYALVQLAYTMGLRPKEISQISFDDISFGTQQLKVCERKGTNPVELPMPEHTVKAIAAYVIGARPQSEHRHVFLTMLPPFRPMSPNVVGRHITKAMRNSDLLSTAYWLRHTYAQNLLEAGTSIFEIKEMLGHDKIESTKLYLHVHIKLMRKVLFDETF